MVEKQEILLGLKGQPLRQGDRVVLLEDVTTTGGSALKAANRLIDMGLRCSGLYYYS